MDKKQHLIWIDLEMTGLLPESDRIIEIATIITNTDLQVVAEGPVLAINQSNEILAGMDDWNQRHHGSSGLIQRVKVSPTSESEAEQLTIQFLSQYCDKGYSPMCGNSICQDRRFLARYMPALESFFHYRNLDVSALKELAKRWRPELMDGLTKQSAHLALEDIRDSINELRYYREHFIKTEKPSINRPD
jgi:oligoribonuclease